MIPIAISSSEADYIRKLLRSQNRKKPKPGPQDHLRHPRKIDNNQTKKKVASKASDNREYQIIYKDSQAQNSQDDSTTIRSVRVNKKGDESGDITENTSAPAKIDDTAEEMQEVSIQELLGLQPTTLGEDQKDR